MSDKFAETNQILFQIARNASLEVFQAETKNKEFETRELSTAEQGNLMFIEDISCIMLIGEEIRVVFKIHYWLENAVKILKKIHPNHPEHVVEKKSRDYMKELSNVVAGRIKYKLLTMKCNIGQSLPINFDGFNQLFFSEKRPNEYSDAWGIMDSEHQEFICSTSIQYYKDSIINKVSSSKHDDSLPLDVELF